MTGTPATPPRAISRGEGRDALCEALARIVARDGLDGVTFRSVAAEAGVTHGLASYHFKNRETMIVEALTWAVHESIQRGSLGEDVATLAEFAATSRRTRRASRRPRPASRAGSTRAPPRSAPRRSSSRGSSGTRRGHPSRRPPGTERSVSPSRPWRATIRASASRSASRPSPREIARGGVAGVPVAGKPSDRSYLTDPRENRMIRTTAVKAGPAPRPRANPREPR